MRKSSRRSDQRRPPRATASHPQVHALDAGRVDENLEHRLRLRHFRNLARVELQREVRPRFAGGVGAEIVGAQRRVDRREVGAQDAVVVDARDPREQPVEGAALRGLGAPALRRGNRRVESRDEQFQQVPGRGGVARERLFHVGLRQRQPELAEPAGIGSKHRGFTPGEVGRQHEAVEAVVVGIPGPHARESRLESRPVGLEVDADAARVLELEVLDPEREIAGDDLVGPLADQLEPEVLDRRQHVRDRDGAQAAEHLELDFVCGLVVPSVKGHGQRIGRRRESLERRDVFDGRLQLRVFLVGGRECVAPHAAEPERRGLAERVHQGVLEPVLPGADRLGDVALELDGVHRPVRIGRRAHEHVQAREHGLGQRHLRFDREAAEGIEREASRCACAPACCSGRVARTRDRNRSGGTGRAARTGGPARARRGSRRRARCARGPARSPGTARRAGRSRARARAPCGRGSTD